MPRRSISTLFGHLKAAPVVSVPTSRPKAMAMPAEELEAMLLKAIPRYRWTADDVVKDGVAWKFLGKTCETLQNPKESGISWFKTLMSILQLPQKIDQSLEIPSFS